MLRAALADLWPWALALAAVLGVLAALVRCFSPRQRWQSLAALHRDESGGVQSLSFVLTVPFFIILMMLAVQITQVMIGLMVVHYAAFAAARSASVWIAAATNDEPANCISELDFSRSLADGTEYVVQPAESGKYEQIRTAAVLACMPIAPSRDLGLAAGGDTTSNSLLAVYQALAPSSSINTRLPQRMANKWAYANLFTDVGIRVFHRADEPALQVDHDLRPDVVEFLPNEIGFRDKIQVTVTHRFALLPGPGRLLYPREKPSATPTPPKVKQMGSIYYTPLSATATLGNEGEKSLVPYGH